MDAEQLPGGETMVPSLEGTTESIGSAWKRKRTKSERMTALASKRWDRGNGQESSRTATHTQVSTPPGPSSASDPAPVHPDELLPAQLEDSSCSDVSPANAGARQMCSWLAIHRTMTHYSQHTVYIMSKTNEQMLNYYL